MLAAIASTAVLLIGGVALCLFLTGCNTTQFTQTKADGTSVTIKNSRLFWTTDSYACTWNTNGASLDVNKSGVDAAAIANVVQAAITAAK